MGKKTRKTRWRTLSISGPQSDSESQNGEITKPYSYHHQPRSGSSWNTQGSRYHSSHSTPTRQHHNYYNSKYENGTKSTRSSSTASENKITFNEDEYTRITTPRQDVLFKKGYLSKPKPYLQTHTPSGTSTGNSTNDTPDHHSQDGAEGTDLEYEQTQFMFPNSFIDQNGIYYINGVHGFEPYQMVMYNPPVCYPTYVNHRIKRYSTDSMTESTSPNNETQDHYQTNGDSDAVNGSHDFNTPVYNVVYPAYVYENGVYQQPEVTEADSNSTDPRKLKKKRRRRKISRSKVSNQGTDEYSDEEYSSEEDLSQSEESSDQSQPAISNGSASIASPLPITNGHSPTSHALNQSQHSESSVVVNDQLEHSISPSDQLEKSQECKSDTELKSKSIIVESDDSGNLTGQSEDCNQSERSAISPVQSERSTASPVQSEGSNTSNGQLERPTDSSNQSESSSTSLAQSVSIEISLVQSEASAVSTNLSEASKISLVQLEGSKLSTDQSEASAISINVSECSKALSSQSECIVVIPTHETKNDSISNPVEVNSIANLDNEHEISRVKVDSCAEKISQSEMENAKTENINAQIVNVNTESNNGNSMEVSQDSSSKTKYRVDAEEFVPRAYRQHFENHVPIPNFIPLPIDMFPPNFPPNVPFIPPVNFIPGPPPHFEKFVPNFVPNQYFMNNDFYHKPQTVEPTIENLPQTEPTIQEEPQKEPLNTLNLPSEPNTEDKESDNVQAKDNKSGIDIAKIVSKLEEAAMEQKKLDEKKQNVPRNPGKFTGNLPRNQSYQQKEKYPPRNGRSYDKYYERRPHHYEKPLKKAENYKSEVKIEAEASKTPEITEAQNHLPVNAETQKSKPEMQKVTKIEIQKQNSVSTQNISKPEAQKLNEPQKPVCQNTTEIIKQAKPEIQRQNSKTEAQNVSKPDAQKLSKSEQKPLEEPKTESKPVKETKTNVSEKAKKEVSGNKVLIKPLPPAPIYSEKLKSQNKKPVNVCPRLERTRRESESKKLPQKSEFDTKKSSQNPQKFENDKKFVPIKSEKFDSKKLSQKSVEDPKPSEMVKKVETKVLPDQWISVSSKKKRKNKSNEPEINFEPTNEIVAQEQIPSEEDIFNDPIILEAIKSIEKMEKLQEVPTIEKVTEILEIPKELPGENVSTTTVGIPETSVGTPEIISAPKIEAKTEAIKTPKKEKAKKKPNKKRIIINDEAIAVQNVIKPKLNKAESPKIVVPKIVANVQQVEKPIQIEEKPIEVATKQVEVETKVESKTTEVAPKVEATCEKVAQVAEKVVEKVAKAAEKVVEKVAEKVVEKVVPVEELPVVEPEVLTTSATSLTTSVASIITSIEDEKSQEKSLEKTPEKSSSEPKSETKSKKKKKKSKSSKEKSEVPCSSSNVEEGYDLLTEKAASLDPDSKTNVEISLEIDKMIQRGLYANLEEKIKSFNPSDSFINSVGTNDLPFDLLKPVVLENGNKFGGLKNFKNFDFSGILFNTTTLNKTIQRAVINKMAAEADDPNDVK